MKRTLLRRLSLLLGLFAILGSSGYIEIAANRGSASQALGVGRGVEVGVILS